MRNLQFLILCAVVTLFAACTGCGDHPVIPDTSVDGSVEIQGIKIGGSVVFDSVSYDRISEPQFKNLKGDLDNFFDHMNDFEFDKHLDYMYDGIWLNDSIRRLTVEQMQTYYDRGYYNKLDSMKVKYVGPIVVDSTSNESICLIETFSWNRIVIEEKYGLKDPMASLQGMLNTRYGKENYYYDEEDGTFYVQAPNKMYAFLDKEDGHFKFMSELYLESPVLGALLEYNTVRALKKMDSKRP